MDGTIADFYGVQGWLEDIRNNNPRPYRTTLQHGYLNQYFKSFKITKLREIVITSC